MFDPSKARSVMNHMNDDHAESVKLYVKAFTDHQHVLSARMISLDETGLDIECDVANGFHTERVTFPEPLKDIDEARAALVNLVALAQSKLDES